ncbi:MAG: IMP dehydrogenase, partial [Bdellovibrionales bacterium RIFOXYD1_FULL_53_11]
MKIYPDQNSEALTFDDVLLLPGYSETLPNETGVDTKLTRRVGMRIPLVSAAMDTVTESKTAITMAQEGGIGVIHKNMPSRQQAFEVEKVKKSEWGMILDPVTIEPLARIGQALELMRTYKISGVPVCTKNGERKKLIGILTNRDLRFETDMSAPVESRMTRMPLITAPEGTTLEQAQVILRDHRVEKLPVVDSEGNLKGLITIKDLKKKQAYPNALKDGYGRLLVGAAVGAGDRDMLRPDLLVEAGADILFVDSAHGHSKGVVEMVAALKKRFDRMVDVVGGNVATHDGAEALALAGADAIKVGIGPGSICTTRVVSGVGVPQLFALTEAVRAARKHAVPVIADGGIKFSGDITKALAAGASSVMIGSLFAGTDEAPGETILYQGRTYKVYRGMGSMEAMSQSQGARERYSQ